MIPVVLEPSQSREEGGKRAGQLVDKPAQTLEDNVLEQLANPKRHHRP